MELLSWLLFLLSFLFIFVLIFSLFKDVKKNNITVGQKITLIGVFITLLTGSGILYISQQDDGPIPSITPTLPLENGHLIGPIPTTPPALCTKKRIKSRDPEKFFSGVVRVGIRGDLPRWSFGPKEAPVGFDIDVAHYIERYLKDTYPDVTFEYEPLQADQRATALDEGCVDIVIGNYSMTAKRDKEENPAVDFAGPYFLDVSGLIYNTDKLPSDYTPEHTFPKEICITSKTTAADYINECGGTTVPNQPNIHECVMKFMDCSNTTSSRECKKPENKNVAGIITDRSILAAYRAEYEWKYPVIPLYCRDTNHLLSDDEQYGIGLKDGSSALCVVLNEAITAFVKDSAHGWNKSYDIRFKDTLLENEKTEHNPLLKGKNITTDFCNPSS